MLASEQDSLTVYILNLKTPTASLKYSAGTRIRPLFIQIFHFWLSFLRHIIVKPRLLTLVHKYLAPETMSLSLKITFVLFTKQEQQLRSLRDPNIIAAIY